MLRAGFDLGTTYSAVYLFDDVTKKMDAFKLPPSSRDFFPSLIVYSKSNPSIRYIGDVAKRYRFSPEFDVYDTFKLALGDGAHAPNGRTYTPLQVTQDFIHEVLDSIRQNKGVNPEDLVLVQSVPDIWKNELQHTTALDYLTQAYDSLVLDTLNRVSFESEPVCAAAYYLNEVCKGKYTGYLVVVDYGGGTLDLTLCRAEKNGTISVLCSCGDGGNASAGCAGNAFDQEVTLRLVEKYGLDKSMYQPGLPAFSLLQSAFEDCKIASTENTRKAMTDYYKSGGLFDPLAFSVPMFMPPQSYMFNVNASDIDQAFQSANQLALQQAVAQMQEECAHMGVDTKSQEDFRVLLVGGFSNLCCVEDRIRKMFESDTGPDDHRFDARMNRESRSIAIAHGACLIAAGITPVEYINQTEIGFYALDVEGNEILLPLLRKGIPVKDYSAPVYSSSPLIRLFKEMPVTLTLFFDGGAGPVKIKMDELFGSLCPDSLDNAYYIGFSIDRHRIPQLHILGTDGAENKFSLYKTISQLPAVMIQA